MSDYEEVLDQARKLSLVDQARLVETLSKLVQARIQAWPKHSILELEGMGKELWRGIDVEKYIEEERNSWERD
jgi:hypothetical protein